MKAASLSACLLLTLIPLSAQAPPRNPVEVWMRTLTLREKVGQLVMVPFYGGLPNPRTREYAELRAMVTDLRVGGLILLNRVQQGSVVRVDAHAVATFLNRMQRLAKVPLLAGGDFERGASMRIEAVTQFPHAMAFGAAGDEALTRALGAATAREARAMGVHWVFAPVADVNNNPDNPVIHLRAFGEDPREVAGHVRAFIEGAKTAKPAVMVTVKHFPGHGDTAADTHYDLATVTAAAERMRALELVPFRAAIEAGVDSVMTAHVTVPALEPERVPATVSKAILTQLLREELGFQGLVSTDALDMRGLTKLYAPGEAAVRALEAGADLLLIPADPRAAVEGVMKALETGRLSRERVERSVRKLLEAKARLGLDRERTVDVEALPDALNTPEDLALAADSAQRAVTAYRNEAGLLPLKEPERACVYVLPPTRTSTLGAVFAATVAALSPRTRVRTLTPEMAKDELDETVRWSEGCGTVVAAYAALSAAYPGRAPLAGKYPELLERLPAAGRALVMVAIGNPYPLRHYPAAPALATFSTVPASEEAAARALLGKAPVSGRPPVSLLPVSQPPGR